MSLVPYQTRGQAVLPAPEAPLRQGTSMSVCVPITISELLNWRQSVGSYRENPEEVCRLLETIVLQRNPTWRDMQGVLNTFLTAEEKRRVTDIAKEKGRWGYPESYLPTQADPGWDLNTVEGKEKLKQYQELILYGVQNCVPKVRDVSKLFQVRQNLEESPAAFYERLCDAARKWTGYDPDDEQTKHLLSMLLVRNSAPDIKRRLEMEVGIAWMSPSQLIDIAYEVYYDRAEREKRERQREIRLQASMLAEAMNRINIRGRGRGWGRGAGRGGAVARGRGQRWRPLKPNQCAICRREGHWKNECPQRWQQQQWMLVEQITPVIQEYWDSDSD